MGFLEADKNPGQIRVISPGDILEGEQVVFLNVSRLDSGTRRRIRELRGMREIFFVISGEMEVTYPQKENDDWILGEPIKYHPGEKFEVPPGRIYRIANLQKEEILWYIAVGITSDSSQRAVDFETPDFKTIF